MPGRNNAHHAWWPESRYYAVEQAAVIERILRHLGLSTDVPDRRPARAPPLELAEASADAPGPALEAAGLGGTDY